MGWTSIRQSRVATKFRLKMTLLNLGIKLTQKWYFRIKKNENYDRIQHIRINLQSFAKYIWNLLGFTKNLDLN